MDTKRVSASKYWFFTFNNYSDEEAESIALCFEAKCSKFIMQEEVGSIGSNKHLQGKICLTTKGRPLDIFKDFKKIHWEKSKKWDGWEYCAKDETHVGKRWMKGVTIPKPLKCPVMHGWQLHVLNLIKDEPDERSIHWYWEPDGGVGKSALGKYLTIKHQAAFFDEGKAADIKASIALRMENKIPLPEIIVMDIPRSVTMVSYTALESIKNGNFFSPKYKSGQITMNSPHVIVFANFEPEYDKMSKDRWKVYDIRDLMIEEAREVQIVEPHSQ